MLKQFEKDGYYGRFGGRFVSETLLPALTELEQLYHSMQKDEKFFAEYHQLLQDFVGRPTPLYYAKNLSKAWGAAKIYLKREDLNHTGSHKLNNALGQALLAKKAGKKRLIAETGAGQHGIATATAAAIVGLKCCVFMGVRDIERQEQNVQRMRMLGAELVPVESGSQTLKDAINEAIRDWVTNVADTHYLIGSAVGPHPYPAMVRTFQEVIGVEARQQILEKEKRLPDEIVACVGGGSNAIGIFSAFLEDNSVALTGVEALGESSQPGRNAATLQFGRAGILHGAMTYLLQDENGNVIETHSISAGLDYPAVGPEHSYLKEIKRVSYEVADDRQALDAFKDLCRHEGIIPALESSHALAHAKIISSRGKSNIIIVNLSGRGDKDLATAQNTLDKTGGAQ